MITNIFKSLLLVTLIAAFSTRAVAQQQPFDDLPPDNTQQQTPPALDPNAPIQIPDDVPSTVPVTPFSTEDTGFQDDEPDQKVEVDEQYAGWEAAGEGTNGERLADSLRANWVMTDSKGNISASVRGIEGADPAGIIVYLMNKGRLVTNVVTDDQGNFVLSNVIEGAYSLVGIGENAFFAFSFNALHYTDQPGSTVPTRLDIIAFQNETSINLDWIRFFSPGVKFRVFGRYSTGEEREDPAERLGFTGLALYHPASAPATSINSHRVVKTADGRFLGRVHQFNSLNGRPVNVRNTKVMLLQGDDVFASTDTDSFGVFEFSEVPSGTYAVVAAGVDGLGCVGVEVVEQDEDSVLQAENVDPAASVFDFTMTSSETAGWLNHVASELAYERVLLSPRPQYDYRSNTRNQQQQLPDGWFQRCRNAFYRNGGSRGGIFGCGGCNNGCGGGCNGGCNGGGCNGGGFGGSGPFGMQRPGYPQF